jgi:anti-sigma regulatory factor (Ser/Thr protein kinase)
VLFYSDGLVEAHNARREMFGFSRLRELVAHAVPTAGEVVDILLEQLAQFTGPGWEQEDDITLVTLQRAEPVPGRRWPTRQMLREKPGAAQDAEWETLITFELPSEPGNEWIARQRVRAAIAPLHLAAWTFARLETAVAEAAMNAMEHGNNYRPEVPVAIKVEASADCIRVGITDQGAATPGIEPELPDLELKLAGRQTPRGWGLFLIKNMVDDLQVVDSAAGHTLRLIVRREEGDHDG